MLNGVPALSVSTGNGGKSAFGTVTGLVSNDVPYGLRFHLNLVSQLRSPVVVQVSFLSTSSQHTGIASRALATTRPCSGSPLMLVTHSAQRPDGLV